MGGLALARLKFSSGARLPLIVLLLVLFFPAQPVLTGSPEENDGGRRESAEGEIEAEGKVEQVEERSSLEGGGQEAQQCGSDADGCVHDGASVHMPTQVVNLDGLGHGRDEKGGEVATESEHALGAAEFEGNLDHEHDSYGGHQIAAEMPCDAMLCTCLSNGEYSLIRMDLMQQCSAFDVYEGNLQSHLTTPAPPVRAGQRPQKPKTVIRQLPDPDEYIQAEREEAKRREQAMFQETAHLRQKGLSEGGHQQQWEVEESAEGVQVVHGVGVEELRLEQDMENMASKKLGAKVLAANSGATRLSEVLRDDPDTYLKNECSTMEGQWIVIELPQVVKVEAITVSVTEMYSARVKTIQVLCREARLHGDAKEIAASRNGTEWNPLAELVAENRRGTHAFRLRWERWAKYLQFRFVSHYGNQKVCAINEIQVFGLTKAEEIMKELEAVGSPVHVSPPVHAEVGATQVGALTPEALQNEQPSTVPSEASRDAEVVEVGKEAAADMHGTDQQHQHPGTPVGIISENKDLSGQEEDTHAETPYYEVAGTHDEVGESGHNNVAEGMRSSEPINSYDSKREEMDSSVSANEEDFESIAAQVNNEMDVSKQSTFMNEEVIEREKPSGGGDSESADGAVADSEENGRVGKDNSSSLAAAPEQGNSSHATASHLGEGPPNPNESVSPKSGIAAGDMPLGTGETHAAAVAELAGHAAAVVAAASTPAGVPRINNTASDYSSAAAAAASQPRLDQLADYAATGMRGLAGSSAIIDMFLQELKMLKLDNVYNKKYMKDAIANITFAFMEHDEQVEETSTEIDALQESFQALESSVDSQVKQLIAEGKRLSKNLSQAQAEISALQAGLKASERQQLLLLAAVCVLLVLRGGWHQSSPPAAFSATITGGATAGHRTRRASRAAAGLWGLLGWTGRAVGCAWAGLLAVCWSCAGRVSYEEIGNCVMKRFLASIQ